MEEIINALKLVLELHRNPDCSPCDKVALAPKTLEQVEKALASAETGNDATLSAFNWIAQTQNDFSLEDDGTLEELGKFCGVEIED